MSEPIVPETPCQSPAAPSQGPLVLPWWEPERITVYREGIGWRTLHGWDMHRAARFGPIGVSPVDREGKAHFIAWDIDSGDPDHVRFVLQALPEGACPLVSWSGKKGWHVWIFPDEPLELEKAVKFARIVREKAGLDRRTCEIFPQGRRSKCLKWPGQPHPDTGEEEVFVPIKALHDNDRYDTPLLLEALSNGLHRTPAHIISEWREKDQSRPRKAPPSGPPPTSSRDQGGTHFLACQEKLALYLLEIAGREPVPIGKEFLCILPGHDERRPSAAFYRMPDGSIFYHDFHYAKYGSPEWLPLGVVYRALKTKTLKVLSPHETARELAELALNAEVMTSLTSTLVVRVEKNTRVLVEIELIPERCISLVQRMMGKKQLEELREVYFQLLGLPPLARVWGVFVWEALISAQAGFREVKASSRYVAQRACVDKQVANRALNLLATLGLIAKVPRSGGEKGDRFVVLEADEGEVRRRWDALGHPSLERFNRELVARCLGEDLACRVFRRKNERHICSLSRKKGGISQMISTAIRGEDG